MPWLRDMPLTSDERAVFDLGLDGAVEQADQVGVGEPHLAGPVVGKGLGPILPLLDPAQPERDEGQVEGPRQAPAQSLADQLGDGVRSVRHRRHVDGDRPVTQVSILPHDVVRAGEDDPLDSGQGRGVKDVGQGIEVGTDQLFPGGELVGVGREMDDRVDAVEMRDPIVVEDREVRHDDVGIVRRSAALSIKTRS